MMWELIRLNKRNSIVLFVTMAAVLIGLGMVIGGSVHPRGLLVGGAAALLVWLVLALVSLSAGDQILLMASRARPVTHQVHPQLFNVVEEMSLAAGLSKIPKIYIIDELAPNAFATGRSPQTASVAVTAGLLAKLNRDQLQGVIAHEISHILHRDILYVTMAGVMLGSIVLLSDLFLRGFLRASLTGPSRRYEGSSRRSSSQAQLVILLIALVAAILAPILAQLLYFALSRQREYLADAGAARLTRYPEGLASALEKIANDTGPPLARATRATAPMYIVNPFKRGLQGWTSTHPPIEQRIKILRAIGKSVSLGDYERAYNQVTGRHLSVRARDEQLPVRPAGRDRADLGPRQERLEAGDLIRRLNGFVFLGCPCGLRLKIPPACKRDSITCPRCGQVLEVPREGRSRPA